jgi:hypothetical protein
MKHPHVHPHLRRLWVLSWAVKVAGFVVMGTLGIGEKRLQVKGKHDGTKRRRRDSENPAAWFAT